MTVLHTILAGSAIADPVFIVHDAVAIYGAQNEAYMSRSAEKWVRGLCFNELGVYG